MTNPDQTHDAELPLTARSGDERPSDDRVGGQPSASDESNAAQVPLSSPAAPSTALPSHPSDQRITSRGITMALIGVIVGAVIGAGATWITNEATLNAEKDRQIESYRREQRVGIYSNVLKSVTSYLNSSAETRSSLYALTLQFPDEAREKDSYAWYQKTSPLVARFNDAYDEVSRSISDSEIISSDGVIAVAHVLNYRCYELLVTDISRVYAPPPPGIAKQNPDPANFDADHPDLLAMSNHDLMNEYIERTKADLNLND